MGTTADGFLSPALEKMASSFGFSESVAGVTLLALGNGAPDVISSLSAASSDSGGLFLAVGSLVGGGIFVSGVVSAVVMLASPKPIHVLGRNFLRDIIFYIISLAVLIVAALVGELTIWFAITFFVIYIVFVIIVVVMDRMEEAGKKKRKVMRATIMERRSTMGIGSTTAHDQQVLDDADLDDEAYYYKDDEDRLVEIKLEDSSKPEEVGFEKKFNRMMTDIQEEKDENDEGSEVSYASAYDDQAEESLDNSSYDNNKPIKYSIAVKASSLRSTCQPMLLQLDKLETIKENEVHLDDPAKVKEESSKKNYDKSLTDQIDKTRIEPTKDLSQFIVDDHIEELIPARISEKNKIIKKSRTMKRAATAKRKIVWSMLKMKKFLKKGIEAENSFGEMNLFNKIVYILIDAPMDFLRRLTIPPPDSESWDRRLAAATPICSIFFIYAVTGFITFTEVPHFSFWILEGVALMLSILI